MKFRTRLIVFYLAATIVSMVIIGAATWGSLELYKKKTVESQLIDQSKLIFAYIKQVFLFQEASQTEINPDSAKIIAGNLSSGIGQVELYGKSLQLLCNPVEIEEESSFKPDQYKKIVLEPALKGDNVFVTKNNIVYYSVPIMNKGKTAGVLVIIYKLNLLNEYLKNVLIILFAGAIVFCLLIVIISFYISKKIVKPIDQLVETTERYAKRDFTVLELNRNDELGRLSKSINSMGSQLYEYIGRQKQFISNISHEIRTPLTAIKGYSEFLYDEVSGDADTEAALNHLKNEAERLEKLVSQLLDLSRHDSFQDSFVFVKTNFSNLLNDTISRMENKAAANNTRIESKISPDVFINADPEKIVQAVVNILDNAIKYSYQGSTIEAEMFTENSNAVFIVKDSGIGIPKEDMKNIFERFYRASNTNGITGTGLGLAISNIIIEKHKGKISMESIQNKGTTVKIIIPQM
ncbi:MAG TPA: HAMP domain-containing sensor histidine kinase [Pseudobacteroides sp.]|nr:HAMP domain-containing sensor histidine kinase [Pseudobacteroides sp.]